MDECYAIHAELQSVKARINELLIKHRNTVTDQDEVEMTTLVSKSESLFKQYQDCETAYFTKIKKIAFNAAAANAAKKAQESPYAGLNLTAFGIPKVRKSRKNRKNRKSRRSTRKN